MDPNKNKNNRGGKDPRRRSLLIGAVLWALVLVFFFHFVAGQIEKRGTEEVPYSTFVQMVKEDRVATVELAANKYTFYLKEDMPEALVNGSEDLAEVLTEQMQKRLTRPTETGELTLCNSLWMGEVFPVKKEYRSQLSERYDATVETVAFGTDAAAKRIADWIAEKTNGLIAPAREAMDFDPLTIAVLFNTIYFRDQWSRPFGSAQSGTFTRADGTTENAAYLHRLTEDTSVVRGEGFLRYSVWYESKGRIVFVLPDEDVALSDLLGTPEKLQTLLPGGEIVRADVDLELPEFTFSDRFELADVLAHWGFGMCSRTARISRA